MPLSCYEFHPIQYNLEKPDVTVKDIEDALKSPDNPLGHARAMLGDTLETRAAIDTYMAGRRYLQCPDGKGAAIK